MEVLRQMGSAQCYYKLPEHQRECTFSYEATEIKGNQYWMISAFSFFFFPANASVTLSCLICWAICFYAVPPLALVPNVLLLPSRGFRTRIQICGKARAAAPS